MTRQRTGPAVTLALLLCAVRAVPAAGPTVAVDVRPAERRALAETVTAYGVLEPDPDQVIAVSIPRAGLITRVWVELGERVEAGQHLLEIATAPDAVMQFQQAQSALDLAQRELARSQRLFDEQLATRAQVDTARAAVSDARSTLAALRDKGIGQATEIVTAPVAGVVSRIDVQQGQRVQADTTTLLLANQHALIARLGVEPEDLRRISPGAAVEVRDVFDDHLSFDGTTRDVHASIDPVTRLVDVLVPVPQARADLLVLGSALSARIRLATVDGTVVPRSAVLRDDRGAYVFTVSDGRARRIDVTTSVAEGDWIAVDGDLAAGTPVIVRGNYGLDDGTAVRTGAR